MSEFFFCPNQRIVGKFYRRNIVVYIYLGTPFAKIILIKKINHRLLQAGFFFNLSGQNRRLLFIWIYKCMQFRLKICHVDHYIKTDYRRRSVFKSNILMIILYRLHPLKVLRPKFPEKTQSKLPAKKLSEILFARSLSYDVRSYSINQYLLQFLLAVKVMQQRFKTWFKKWYSDQNDEFLSSKEKQWSSHFLPFATTL